MATKLLTGIFCIASLMLLFPSCHTNKQDGSKSQKNEIKENTDAFANDSTAFYENILSKDSLNIELRLALATNYYAERNFDKAIYHLLIVYNIDNNNIEALINLGNVYYDWGQNEKAIEFYEKALVLDTKNVNVRCDLATCYLNIKDPEKALSLLKKNLGQDKNHVQTHHNLAVVYKELGKTKEAEEEINIYNNLNK